jgi:hypothetical protein
MNSQFSKAFAVALGGYLASCASTPHSASASLQGRPQLADARQSPTDAALRVGVPTQEARSAAAGACALVPDAEQNVCPLQRTPVLGTRQLVRPLDPKGYSFTPAGVVVYALAAPGLTPEWLGNALQARESCPLAEPESTYSVTPTRNGFAVSIRSPHTEAAKRIFDVSERLAPSNAPQWTRIAVR